MEILSKLFGSSAKVKIIRLFILNPEEPYEKKDIVSRVKVSVDTAVKELRDLHSIGLIKKRSFFKEVKKGKGGKELKKQRVNGWILDPKFEYLGELQTFMIQTLSIWDRDIIKRLKPAIGQLKLVAIAGVFLKDWESRIDILIVGDKIKDKQLSAIMKSLEAEIGREIRFCVFSAEDFLYRLNVCDKLIRDIFDYNHRLIFDKTGASLDRK